MMQETPRTTGFPSTGPRRFSLAASHFRQFGVVSSPLATSSPSPLVFSSAGAVTLPDRMPLRRPKQPPQKCLPIVAPSQYYQHFPSSRTNTIRSTDLSSIYTMHQDEVAFDERNAQLLQCIQMQQELINQANTAIALCRKKYRFSGTLQELSAQRLLLVSQERLTLLNRQLEQLKDQRILANLSVQLDDIPESVDFDNEDEQESVALFSRYTLYIDKIVLTLNPSFSLKKFDKDSSFAFVVLCRHANTIYATQIANVLDVGELRNTKVKFKELIVFEEMPQDFCILIEVFAMKIAKRMDYKWHCMWNFAAKTFRNFLRSFSPNSSFRTDGSSDNSRRSIMEGGDFSASPTMAIQNQSHLALGSEFRRCGYLHLNMETLAQTNNNTKFFLSDADYPMEGSIDLFARFASSNTPLQPPRPDSTDVDLRFNDY